MGIFNPQTFLGEMLDKAAELDRSEGRNPQQRDGALAYACEVYSTAQYEYAVPADTAAALAAIASGVASPWIGPDGRLID
jgi:hypothetical protein